MTIRSRLLILLLPTLTALVALIALFFYFNWSDEIINSFKTRLQSIVIATAPSISSEELEWIENHLKDPHLSENPRYQQSREELIQLKQKLPIDNLYIVRIEPIRTGDQKKLEAQEETSKKHSSSRSSESGYKQIYLLDASHPKEHFANSPGEIDFSETDENKVYFTKQAFVTPIYEARKTGERFISAYAPIINAQGNVNALLGADVSMSEIDQKLHRALLAIFLSTFITLLLVMATVYLIANRISRPVQQLNQAALNIAAGNYEANIQVEGPKEIVELANTFNTMSECLVENISRLRESSLIRERMYGEYECALLLQYYMLQKTIEDFQHPHLQIRLTSVNFSNIQKGLLLKVHKNYPTDLCLTLIEAMSPGFEALYNLNRVSSLPVEELHEYPYIECAFKNNYSSLNFRSHQLFLPLVWSMKLQQFVKKTPSVSLKNQDVIFLYNSGLIEQFKTEEEIELWFSKILRHFSEDGLDIIHTMLTNELNFLAKRENLKGNFQILSIQVKMPDSFLIDS